MPLDAICLTGVVRELRDAVLGLRIEKIQQPARDQVILTLRGSRKLLLCAGASQARIHLTTAARENPAQPPMFCMLLRKHLGGGRLSAIDQPALERAVILTIDMVDEMGEPGQRRLVIECMGRYSNLILLDGQDRIIDCLRRVDMEMSEKRQVLPGLFYRLPPAQEKLDPLSISGEDFRAMLDAAPDGTEAARWLLDRFTALSPLVCRELAHADCQDGEHLFDNGDRERLAGTFSVWQEMVRGESGRRFTPWMLTRDGTPSDFSYMPIEQYGKAMEGQPWDAFSPMLDAFYEKREQAERVRQRGADLQRTAANARDRARRKLVLQEKEYAQTQDRDRLRVCGELITANLYRMEKGQSTLRAQNYYEEGCPEMDIPLDPLLTPQQNAAKYFKRYSKAKTAEKYLSEQMAAARRERDWLESVLDELSRAETEQDFVDIRRELREAGHIRGGVSGKREPRRGPSRPRAFRSSGGLRILVGRSNTQNDQLVREAFKSDYWFHTQRIHGSHVILCAEGREPDERSMTEAAMLAAWFSQGREGGQVAVDYTQVKNVKKPAGARPGMVVYDPYQTAYVTPEEELVKSLAEK
ncbi:MAG: fibronectin/fibrinogen-binding protein [Oscillospiraceae bacterium]|nr:fibronectin/fibrinogen-binding protein [Oscillospiraceae bacterium]MCI9316414.1 fibronectin/fibrinogen-binding protein [Oscillospiraceae bacterium]